MERSIFTNIRNRLNKTQGQMAQLLGISIQTIRSYEQGWRKIPIHIERQAFFLISMMKRNNEHDSCWTINDCPDKLKKNCPSWEFQAGEYCWLINGTYCKGTARANWEEKMNICRNCKVITSLLEY